MALTNMQYDEIIRSYNRQELENKRQLDERISIVYEKIPRIREINSEIASLSLNTAKKLLMSEDMADKNSLDCFKEKLHALSEEKMNLLKQNGFPSDYMDMHYKCADCQDSGYIDNKKCHCFKRAEIEILYRQSNLQGILDIENFDTFDLECFDDTVNEAVSSKSPRENMRNVLAICHNFTDNFGKEDSKYHNLFFVGETGVGKTFLTNCIAKELLEKSISVIYLSANSFFDVLGDAQFGRSMDAKNKTALILDCDLLIIDDLGTELSNAFTNSELFNIINDRLLHKKSTIISTNLNFSELMNKYSERITSRLKYDYTFIKVFGDDLRHKL